MRVSFNAIALLVASVSASQTQHIDLQDPVLRELYLEDLDNLRHPNHHKASLVATVPAELLPGNHELVDEALTGMPVQFKELKQKQAAVNEAQGKLRGFVTEASAHSSDAAHIKHIIARKEAQLRFLKQKQHGLEDDAMQIEGAHTALDSSVHQIHDPNVEKAQNRLQKKQARLTEAQGATQYLLAQRQKAQSETTEAIKEEEVAKRKLFARKAETTLALQQEDIAERKAVYDKQVATEEAQSLKYAEGEEKMEMGRLTAAEKVAAEVHAETHDATTIRAMEEVEDAERAMRTEKYEFENWKTNAERISAQSSNMMKQSSLSHTRFLEVEGQVAKATQQQAEAAKLYKLKQAAAVKEVRTLKYITTKYQGEAAKLKVAEAAAKSADNSVKKVNAIRANEEQKVHHYLAKGTEKIQKKMKKVEAASAETSSEIDSLRKQYDSWQQEQFKRSQEVDETQQESARASQDYATGQRETFTKAQEKVFEDQVSDSRDSWGGQWASEGGESF